MAQNIRVLVYSIQVADSAGNYAFVGSAVERGIPVGAPTEFYPVNTPRQFPGLENIIYSKIVYQPGGSPSNYKEAYVMDSVDQLRSKANA